MDKLKSSELTDPDSVPENSLELLILTVKLKSEGDEELPLDFTFTKVEEDWRIARINRVNA